MLSVLRKIFSKIPIIGSATRKLQAGAIAALVVAALRAFGIDFQIDEGELTQFIETLGTILAFFGIGWLVPESAAKIEKLYLTK